MNNDQRLRIDAVNESVRVYKYSSRLGLCITFLFACVAFGSALSARDVVSLGGSLAFSAFFIFWFLYIFFRTSVSVVYDGATISLYNGHSLVLREQISNVVDVQVIAETYESGVRVYFQSGESLLLEAHLEEIEELTRILRADLQRRSC